RCGNWWWCYETNSIKIPLLTGQRPASPRKPHRPRGVACQLLVQADRRLSSATASTPETLDKRGAELWPPWWMVGWTRW
ncbi:unnamed protein product, partial [Ectocarpus sp. 4 AP-2014]